MVASLLERIGLGFLILIGVACGTCVAALVWAASSYRRREGHWPGDEER